MWTLVAWAALLFGSRSATAARGPDAVDLGVELLVRTAEECDLIATFRLMASASFSAEWMTRASSKPLRAALRGRCSQVVAALMLHPDFDFSTVARFRQRRELIKEAQRDGKPTSWAVEVMEGIRICKVAREELEWSKGKDFDWYLPEVGEWSAPLTIAEMGLDLRAEPAIHSHVLSLAQTGGMLTTSDGIKCRADVVVVLWYAMVAYLREPVGSERRSELHRHLRSLGWANFFASRSSLRRYAHIMDLLSKGHIGGAEVDGGPEALQIVGNVSLESAGAMGARLAMIWNKTGDFVVFL